MDEIEFITKKLGEFGSIIPYDAFNDLVTSVAHNYKLSLSQANKLVHSLRGSKEVGSQEFNTQGIGNDKVWHGQDIAVNFGSNQPGHLAEPKSSLKQPINVGDRVRVPASTWATAYTGVIERINDNNTVDIRDEATGSITKSVSLDSLGNPLATGRYDIRDQRRRVGDPCGLMDGPLPIGQEEVRERTTPWAPKGQEGKDVKNPESLFYKEARAKFTIGEEVTLDIPALIRHYEVPVAQAVGEGVTVDDTAFQFWKAIPPHAKATVRDSLQVDKDTILYSLLLEGEGWSQRANYVPEEFLEKFSKRDVLYSFLIDTVVKECGVDVANDVSAFLNGQLADPTRELQSVLHRYNLSRLS